MNQDTLYLFIVKSLKDNTYNGSHLCSLCKFSWNRSKIPSHESSSKLLSLPQMGVSAKDVYDCQNYHCGYFEINFIVLYIAIVLHIAIYLYIYDYIAQ